MIGRRHERELSARLERLEAAVQALTAEVRTGNEQARRTNEDVERLRAILRVVNDREPETRERLTSLRQTAAYEHAFTDPEPLVSVVIPTYDRGDLLLSRAIPSVLAQTYTNWEIVVVGDTAPDETGRMIAELGELRVRYHNLTIRGPYPEDPRDLWHVAGIPARNAAVSRARGSWIAPLDDDDAFAPDHIAVLLDRARSRHGEVAFGLLRCLMNDGSTFNLGTYPPEYGQFGWQSAIFHGGLRFLEMELSDALFSSPGDWSLCRRMIRAGVRFTMVDEIVADHYESRIDPGKEPAKGLISSAAVMERQAPAR